MTPTVTTLMRSYQPSFSPLTTRNATIVTSVTTTAVEMTICACSSGPREERNVLNARSFTVL